VMSTKTWIGSSGLKYTTITEEVASPGPNTRAVLMCPSSDYRMPCSVLHPGIGANADADQLLADVKTMIARRRELVYGGWVYGTDVQIDELARAIVTLVTLREKGE
jgi:hypothetical protein